MSSVKSVSNGSEAFMWTYRQLSETDWSGAQVENNSSINLGKSGKQGTSTRKQKKKGKTLRPETSTTASSYTVTVEGPFVYPKTPSPRSA